MKRAYFISPAPQATVNVCWDKRTPSTRKLS